MEGLRVPETEADRNWSSQNAPYDCCRVAANLTTIEKDNHVLVRRCSCGRRHFKALMPLPGAVSAAPEVVLRHGG